VYQAERDGGITCIIRRFDVLCAEKRRQADPMANSKWPQMARIPKQQTRVLLGRASCSGRATERARHPHPVVNIGPYGESR